MLPLTIQVLVSLGDIFEAGSDFGQIGPAVSFFFRVARSSAPVNSVTSQIFEAGNDFGQIGPAVSGGGFTSGCFGSAGFSLGGFGPGGHILP